MSIDKELQVERRIGQVSDGPLVGQVTLRGNNVMLAFVKEGRGWSVTLSPKIANDLASMILEASYQGGYGTRQ